jgi:GrxC family glutaredoxin
MANITIYSKNQCAYCASAKRLLAARGIAFVDIDITNTPALEQEVIARTGQRTVPQIFIDNKPIGGFVELARMAAKGELDHLKNVA